MIREKSIICFANDYDGDPTSKHQVMNVLGRQNRIFWINSIAMRSPNIKSKGDLQRIKSKIRKFFCGVEERRPNFYVFTPLVLPFPHNRAIKVINKYILILFLKFYCKKFKLNNIQIWTFLPNMVGLIGALGEQLVLYYCVDEWSEFSFLPKEEMKEMEQILLKKADIVLTTADKLYKSKAAFNKRTYLIPHGVDFDFFNRALSPDTMVPDDIKSLPGKIIGFFGLIHDWIDLDLISQIAKEYHRDSIVIIGKVEDKVDITSLRKQKNIKFLGRRDYSLLPGYCKGIDVALIPFKINELTANVNPIKLREYLSAGLPVVSTALPEVKRCYSNVVHVAESRDEAVRFVAKAAAEKCEPFISQRLSAVIPETWEGKVEQISSLIQGLEKNGIQRSK